jgi:hypothetical protein
MAYSQGTATDYLDLLNQLVDFLTTGLGSDNWTLLKNDPSGFGADTEVYLRAPGLSVLNNIYVNIKTFSDSPNNIFTWNLQGATAFNTGLSFNAQPGCIPTIQGIPRMLFLGSCAYTFVANSQRVICVVNVGTVIESCYLGWITPFGPPSSYPAPLYIGGCHHQDVAKADTTIEHSWWLHNLNEDTHSEAGAHARLSNGVWARNRYLYNGTPDYNLLCCTHPYAYMTRVTAGGVANIDVVTTENGDYVKHPVMLTTNQGSSAGDVKDQPIGQFDGVFWIPGVGVSQDDILNCDGTDHLIFQNAFRTDLNSYAALALV